MSDVPTSLAWTYTGLWGACCLVAAVLLIRERQRTALLRAGYWRNLISPWKLATASLAGGLLVGLAPYANDPSWDRVDAGFMSVLTFATAPWSVATLYRTSRGMESKAQGFAAACVLLFTATWSYDLYLFLRDGHYPETWLGNLVVGPLLYAAAGLFWNLHWSEARGVHLAFRDPAWPDVNAGIGLRRVLLPALILMALAAAAFIPYLWPFFRALAFGR